MIVFIVDQKPKEAGTKLMNTFSVSTSLPPSRKQLLNPFAITNTIPKVKSNNLRHHAFLLKFWFYGQLCALVPLLPDSGRLPPVPTTRHT